jgi:hypothetical protein
MGENFQMCYHQISDMICIELLITAGEKKRKLFQKGLKHEHW